MFRQIHEIVFFGKGGYDWDTVYNMPIWLRNFIYKTILEYYEKEGNAAQGTTQTVSRDPKVPKEAFSKRSDMTVRKPVRK